MRIRLNEKDELCMKAGGWALYENVITDSIVSSDISVIVKNANGGKLDIRSGSKNGTILSSCDLPKSGDEWIEVECTTLSVLSGIQDLYITVSGNTDELILRNIKFGKGTSTQLQESTSEEIVKAYYDQKKQRVDLGKSCKWTLYDIQGYAISNGNGQYIEMKRERNGVYIVKFCDEVLKITHCQP